MMKRLPAPRSLLAWPALITSLLLGACASPPGLDAQWSDPSLAGRSYAGTPLLVACSSPDVAAQRLCEDQMLAKLQAAGGRGVLARNVAGAPSSSGAEAEAYLPAARSAATGALLYTKVAASYAGTPRSGSSVGIGLGGFGGGSVGFGVGMSVPIGGRPAPDLAWVANSSVVDVASGRTAWSASATGKPSDKVNEQLGSLAERLVDGARKAGFL